MKNTLLLSRENLQKYTSHVCTLHSTHVQVSTSTYNNIYHTVKGCRSTSAKHMWAFQLQQLNSEEYPHPLTRNNLEPNLQHTQNTHQCNINKQKFKCFYFRRVKFPKKDLKKNLGFFFFFETCNVKKNFRFNQGYRNLLVEGIHVQDKSQRKH